MRWIILSMGCLACVAAPAFAVGPFDFRLVAETGQTDSDMEVGESFGDVGFFAGGGTFASIADDGRVQFMAVIEDGSGGVGSLWEETGSGLNLIGRQGGQVAGMPPGVTHHITPVGATGLLPRGNGDGEIIQVPRFVGSGITSDNNSAVISNASGSFEVIAQKGDVPPGFGPGDEFSSISQSDYLHNKNGDALFWAGFGPSDKQGLWSFSGGTLSKVAVSGDPAPGTEAGTVFGLEESGCCGHPSPALNDTGHFAFQDELLDGAGASRGDSLWSNRGGSLGLVVREGDAAPGLGPGVAFGAGFDNVHIDAASRLTFLAAVTGTGVDTTNDGGIWSDRSGSLAIEYREGDAAGSIGPGVVFDRFRAPRVTADGDLMFSSDLIGTGIDATNDSALWTDRFGSLALLAQTGTQAPDLLAGVLIEDIDTFTMSDEGFYGFQVDLTGTSVDDGNDAALYVGFDDEPMLLLREGELFDGKTISGFGGIATFGSGDVIRQLRGDQFVFGVTFTDGSSGVYVTTIPEPGTMALLALAGASALRRRRSRSGWAARSMRTG